MNAERFRKKFSLTGCCAAVAALIALFAAGCIVTSVYPFYTEKDVVFDPALVGKWIEAGATNESAKSWQFAKASDEHYLLSVNDDGESRGYDAHLFRLKQQLFLDLCTTNRAEDTLPVHYVLKVPQIHPTLTLEFLDYDWLEKLVEKRPRAIRHMMYRPSSGNTNALIVLTADTDDLQKFILKYSADTNAFRRYAEMQRHGE